MAKKSIDEQLALAKKRVRDLEAKKLRAAEKRAAKRYATMVAAVPDIDEYDDDEFDEFVQRLARNMSNSTEVIPEPSTGNISFEE